MRPIYFIALIAAFALGAGLTAWLGQKMGTDLFSFSEHLPAPAAEQQEKRSGPNSSAASEKTILHYRHPHNPRVTSPEPRKDEMGMDYIAVYADEGGAGPGIRIAPETIQNLGVRTAVAGRGDIAVAVEAAGYIAYDETRLSHVHIRSEGWVERLAARSLGQPIRRGELLFELYSPILVSAQEEFLHTLAMNQPAISEASRRRLLALGLDRQTVAELEADGRVRRLIPVFARQDGVLSELAIREGMFVTPGLDIMTIANLDRVWVQAEIFADQAALVATGQRAVLELEQAPGPEIRGQTARQTPNQTLSQSQGKPLDQAPDQAPDQTLAQTLGQPLAQPLAQPLEGVVDFIYPGLDPASRALRARLSFANPGHHLKPDMFSRVRIFGQSRRQTLLIPREALIRSGEGQRVIVARGEGRFEAVEVATGIIDQQQAEILAGLNPGDEVVISAQFLIDSESSLRGALTRLTPVPGFTPESPLDSTADPADPAAFPAEVWSDGIYHGPGQTPGTISLSHQPIPQLGWPAMTMDLELAPNLALPAALEPGAKIAFALEQLDPVTFRIVALGRAASEVRP